MANLLSVYPTQHVQIEKVIIDQCADIKLNPIGLLDRRTRSPYRGTAASAYLTPITVDMSSGYESFISLIGAPTHCISLSYFAPYPLQTRTALRATSRITAAALAGPNLSSASTAGAYHLDTASRVISASQTSPQRTAAPSRTRTEVPLKATVAGDSPGPTLGVSQPDNVGTHPTLPEITIGGFVVSPNADGTYVVESQTLKPGGQITVSGTRYSIAPLASYTVVKGTTYQVGSDGSILLTRTTGGSIAPPSVASDYIVGTQTFVRGGPAITISGMRYSLASGDSYPVVSSVTESVAVQTGAPGLGGYLISGLGASPTGTASGEGVINVTPFTGGAKRFGDCHISVATGALILMVVFLLTTW